MHKVLKALSPRVEVTAWPGDVDNLTNQDQLTQVNPVQSFLYWEEDPVRMCILNNLQADRGHVPD